MAQRSIKTVLVIVAGLALVTIGLVASQEVAVQQQSSATHTLACNEDGGCQRADCPNASACSTTEAGCAGVDAEKCIGCVRCVNVSPEAFRMNSDTGKAEVIAGAPAEGIARGAQACPVHAVTQ